MDPGSSNSYCSRINYIYIYQVIMWYILTLYNGTYQLYLNQTGGEAGRDPVLRCEAQKISGWFCKNLLSPSSASPLLLSCYLVGRADSSTTIGCYYDSLPPSPFPDSFSHEQYAYRDEWLLICGLSIPKANHFGRNRTLTPNHFSQTLKTLWNFTPGDWASKLY